ncbi:hypothetical protein AB4865_09560 [Capnocytophaga sp. ARDL2]|uniref:hypothetical protein n=1 Tax=Capnocytophaga sp. ARDL2 TaxID=3238809 RepID=UPI003555FEB3
MLHYDDFEDFDFMSGTGKDGKLWELDFSNFHFNNNRLLAQALNRLIVISIEDSLEKDVLTDLTLKTLLVRIIQTQQFVRQLSTQNLPNQLLAI